MKLEISLEYLKNPVRYGKDLTTLMFLSGLADLQYF